MHNQSVKDVQSKILEVMKYIDKLCRENDIEYFIMGGTALGAVRHGGFIPWDDDLDIFMKPSEYKKFKEVFEKDNSELFVLQEWRETPHYLEYAKVRMNGTTFIEENFKDKKDMHHGIYVDIMILHKAPNKKRKLKSLYFKAKYITLHAISKRNWKPKTTSQKLIQFIHRLMPNKWLIKRFYKHLYKYEDLKDDYVYIYWITPAKYHQGIFEAEAFDHTEEILFEDISLLGPTNIKRYLELRYGNYMKLPSEEQQKEAVHAMIYDTEKDYKEYMK